MRRGLGSILSRLPVWMSTRLAPESVPSRTYPLRGLCVWAQCRRGRIRVRPPDLTVDEKDTVWPGLHRFQGPETKDKGYGVAWWDPRALMLNVPQSFGIRQEELLQDGAEIVNGVADRVRAELLRNMKLADLLRPSSTKVPVQKAS